MGRKNGIKLGSEAVRKAQSQYSSKFKTHKELAVVCKLGVSTVRRFFTGGPISNETFQTICTALALDPCELIQQTLRSEVIEKDAKSVCEQSPYEQTAAPNSSNKENGIPLPPHYWERIDNSRSLRTLVTQAYTIKVGIFGMPGIGKTVLASALAQDKDMQTAFPDGVFWILCGQERSPTSLQMQLARALDHAPQPFVGEQSGRTFLSKQIGFKKCLVILDDVWQIEQINAFDAIGANCKILITTQNQELLTTSGSEKYEIELLNELDALASLSQWSGQGAKSLESAREVAKQCEGLPLALALCGVQIRDGSSWEDIGDALKEAEIGFLDHQLGSLERALKVSVDALIKENAENGRLYQMLAVFSKHTPIPEEAILTLWLHGSRLNERRARQLITRLARKALLTISGEHGKRSVSLHGLQHSYLYNTSYDLENLNDKLLNAYQNKCSFGWTSGPNDGYYLEHLVEHLLKSGRENEVYELLITSSAWMQRKFKDCQGDTAYVADLNLVLSKFCDPLTSNQLLLLSQLYTARQAVNWRVSSYSDTDLQILVLLNRPAEALAHARLRAEAEERFQGLVIVYESLKENEQTTHTLLDEILKAVREIEFPLAQNHAQLKLQKILNSEELLLNFEKTVTTFQDVPSSVSREPTEKLIDKDWINGLVSFSDEERKQLKESFNLFREVGDLIKKECYEDVKLLTAKVANPYFQALLLEEYVKSLIRVQQFNEAEAMIEEILIPKQLVSTLTDLALALARSGQLEKANGLFTRAKSITENHPRELREVLGENFNLGKTLLAVVKELANVSYVEEAEEMVRRINHPFWQATMLTSLVSTQVHLGCPTKAEKLLDELKEIATQVNPHEARAQILQEAFMQAAELGFQVDANSFLTDLLSCIKEIESEFLRACEQAYLVRSLAQLQRIAEARELLRHIKDTYWYTIGLTHLAKVEPQQTDALFAEALASVQKIENQGLSSEAKWEIECAQRKAMNNNSAKEILPKMLGFIEYENQYLPAKARRDSSRKLAQAQFFGKAFKSIDPQTLEDFFIVLAQWIPSFEKVEQGLSLRVMREGVRIAGWTAPEWMKISELF